MTQIKTLDVRGLSCPEPAMLTREKLIDLGSGTLIVLSDSFASRTNIERTGNKIGWQADVTQDDNETYRITLTK